MGADGARPQFHFRTRRSPIHAVYCSVQYRTAWAHCASGLIHLLAASQSDLSMSQHYPQHQLPDISSIIGDPHWGETCPVCGDPFTPAKSGVVWGNRVECLDAFGWDRVCQAPAPDELQAWIDERDAEDMHPAVPVCYVHTVADTESESESTTNP